MQLVWVNGRVMCYLVTYWCCELFRRGVVRAATIEEIEAQKSLIEKDSVSVSDGSLQDVACG